MKSLLIALVLVFGVATVASVVLPSVALACDINDPTCGGYALKKISVPIWPWRPLGESGNETTRNQELTRRICHEEPADCPRAGAGSGRRGVGGPAERGAGVRSQ